MTQNKLYFLPVFEHEGGVWANRPNGEAARICVLIEDIHFDADRLLEQMEDNAGTAPPSGLIMQSVAGTILAGQQIYLDDILGWAIEHGYLDELGDQFATHQGATEDPRSTTPPAA